MIKKNDATYFVKSSSFKIIIIFAITFILAELTSKALVKFGFLNSGLPAWVSLRIHEDYTHWHPKNSSFILEKKNCWVSKVSYDLNGLRKTSKLKHQIDKKTIALLGDSMVENIELSDGEDLGSLIQLKLNDYNVLNFGARGTGLADQLEIYNKLIKKEKIDYLFLFVTENDIYNNVNKFTTFYHKRYDFINGKVVEIQKNKKYLENYNSLTKKFRRDGILFLKKLDLYKIYLQFHYYLTIKKSELNKKNNEIAKDVSSESKFDLNEKKKEIYKYIKKNFDESLSEDVELFVFLNIRSYMFESNKNKKNKQAAKIMQFIEQQWKNYPNLYNPLEFSKNILIEKNKFHFPYLSFTCDGHYSRLGANIISDYVSYVFLNN
ncbi:SGNH/GDSL hydrolase family protein [Candidatus Pelagibacter sp.]|nr:SGNH/GDSL hydrolase family protein [Candidatus Pelagibacter sp.]